MKRNDPASGWRCLCLFFTLLISVWGYAETPSVIIIGGGPAGMTAAQTLASLAPSLPITLIKSPKMGQLELASAIDNWPGLMDQSGYDLYSAFESETLRYHVDWVEDEITSVDFSGHIKTVYGHNGQYSATHVIVATGAVPKIPPQLKGWLGKGVHTCATCDGPGFVDRDVIVIGSGSTALEQSLELNALKARVSLIIRGAEIHKAEPSLFRELIQHPEIAILYQHHLVNVTTSPNGEITGTSLVNDLNRVVHKPAQGIFPAIGQEPITGFLNKSLILTTKQYIARQHVINSGCPATLYKTHLLQNLGEVDIDDNNWLVSSARGVSATLKLAQIFRKKRNHSPRVVILGGGIGGYSAALYALRYQYDVTMVLNAKRRSIPFFWPTNQPGNYILPILKVQTHRLNLKPVAASIYSTRFDEEREVFLVTTSSGTIEADAVIANTLEYHWQDLGLEQPPSVNQDYQWWATSENNIFTAGDVAEQADLPKQAITAAYSGHLSALLLYRKIYNPLFLLMDGQDRE